MSKIFKKEFVWPILLVLIAIIIGARNYSPRTWLSGWDTLHPEFNFSLAFKRALSGAWQEHQGLGAAASQAHAAELPRLIFLFLSSLILPISFLRYFYFFVCLVLGPLGVYFFFKEIILKEQNVPAFLAALFYLLNLGTVQHFFVPLEMFATQYAALGWLFWQMTEFIQTGKKKNLVIFAIISFLASPMAHTATLFYVYLSIVILYLLSFQTKRSWLIILAILATNFFWLGPNLYYVFQHGHEVQASKIHQLFTDEAIAQSREFSRFQDVVLLKSFLFNWQVYKKDIGFRPLLLEWQKHLQKLSFLGYGFFALVLVGLIRASSKWKLIFVFLFFLMMILNPVFSPIYNWFNSHWSLFGEILRFPFTKFSILLIFVEAIFFGQAINLLFSKSKVILLLAAIGITGGLIFYMWPVFSGYLISPQMKVKIPDEYFEMFAWFDQQDEGRVLKLPMHHLWGWNYYNWGYQGAGFLWFGLKQPLLDREFDRWSKYNQEAYRELSYGLYSQDPNLFGSFLQKYDIKYVLLDEHIFEPGQDQKVLFLKETKNILDQQKNLQLIKSFGDKINIYKINSRPEKTIYQLSATEQVDADDYGLIISQLPSRKLPEMIKVGETKLNFSELNLFPENCGQIKAGQNFAFDLMSNGSFRLFAQKATACVRIPLAKLAPPLEDKNYLVKPKIVTEGDFDFCLFDNRLGRCASQRFAYPFFEIIEGAPNYQLEFSLKTNTQAELKVHQLKLIFYRLTGEDQINLLQEGGLDNLPVLQRQNINCGIEPQKYFRKIINSVDGKYIEYFSQGGRLCDTFYYPQLVHNQGYALLIESRNIEGLPIRLCLTNYKTKHCDLDIKLHNGRDFKNQIFLIPPQATDSQGYDVNLANYSIGRQPSINQLKVVKIFPVDYEWLRPVDQKKDNFLIFPQAYDAGWVALAGLEPLRHVVANNWANGWELEDKDQQPWIFFWPQALEYLGFLALLALLWWGFGPRDAQDKKDRCQQDQIERVADLKKAEK